MGRKKSSDIALIGGNKKERTRIFKKWKDGIMKKANELSILCDVQVCVLIFGSDGEPPSVWPKEPEILNNILARYHNTPLEERQKRALNLSSMLKKSQKDGFLDNVGVKQVENLPEICVPRGDNGINNLSAVQLMELANRLDYKLQSVKARIDVIKRDQFSTMIMKGAQCYGGGEVQRNDLQAKPSLQYQRNNFVDYHIINQYLEEQRRNDEEWMKKFNMMDNNNVGGFCNLSNDNINDVNTSNYLSGFVGRHSMNDGLLPNCDPSTSMTRYDPQHGNLPTQAHQFNGGHDQPSFDELINAISFC